MGQPITPQLPPGYTLDSTTGATPPLPPGYRLDSASTQAPSSLLSDIGQGVGNYAIGVAKGLGQDVNGVSGILNKIPVVGKYLAPASGIERAAEMETPSGTAQDVGAFVGRVAPSLVAPEVLPEGYLAQIAGNAVAGGLSDPSHPIIGSVSGGVLGAGGQLLSDMAPTIGETAQRLGSKARAWGKTPGKALLEDTTGFTPQAVLQSSKDKIADLSAQITQAASRGDEAQRAIEAQEAIRISGNPDTFQQTYAPPNDFTNAHIPETQGGTPTTSNFGAMQKTLQNAASKSTAKVSIDPVMDLLNAVEKRGKPGTTSVVGAIKDQIAKYNEPGQSFANWTPSKLLALKQDVGALKSAAWSNPEHKGGYSVLRNVYGMLDAQLDKAMPETAALNQRISGLIEVRNRAATQVRNAGIFQNSAHRLAAHTGALAGAGFGSYEGQKYGGFPGAVMGGIAGTVLPEVLVSPTGLTAAARLARYGRNIVPRLGTPIAVSLSSLLGNSVPVNVGEK